MYIKGSFVNQKGSTVTVHIVTGADRSETLEIGSESSGLYFTDDPAEITSEVNDTFDHLLRRSATIRLLARNFMPDFFSTSCRNAVVNIYKDEACVFAGFIEPQAYSQSFNEVYDEIELNCVDALSALQYSKYKGVGEAGSTYESVKGSAGQRSLLDIMRETLTVAAGGLDAAGGRSVRYLYDGSKGADARGGDVFSQLEISELLFLGDEEDDVWRHDQVLEEILRYLNLHIVQEGLTFYIFSWETVKGSATIAWRDILQGGSLTTARSTVTISTDNVEGCDTKISIGEVYNQLLLTCEIKSVETVVESPQDEDLLTSPYSGKQKYMTEYSSDGEGETAYNAFYAMTHDEDTAYEGANVTDWYVQVMDNPQWTFYRHGGTDVVEEFCRNGTDQQALPNYLGLAEGAALLSFGSVKRNMAGKDNAPVYSISMDNYFVLSLTPTGEDTEAAADALEARIRQNIPYAVYEGATAAALFSPSDDAVVNYIVFTGRMILNPVMGMTDFYKTLHAASWDEWNAVVNPWWHNTVPSRTNGDGRYYTRRYWKAERPGKNPDDVEWDQDTHTGFCPFTGEGPQQYEFSHSAVGDGTDQVSKVAVLACMLVIGDKCAVEKTPDDDLGTGVPYTGAGAPQDFVWKEYKTLAECADEDEYYRQSFTLGFDPKIGDKLIGTEYDMQVNHDYAAGLDVGGIIIPITKADKISGSVKFMVLGPVNATWSDYVRRHPTFFRHTKWTENSIPLLNHVSSIMIRQLEIKVYSDGDTVTSTGQAPDNDVIYMSDTNESFTNKKDDLTFKISSDLTREECKRLGVSTAVKLSTPIDTATGSGVLTIYDRTRGVQAKAEQLYIDSYYGEYHVPRVVMEQKLADTGGTAALFNHYRHPAMDKEFFVQGMGRNLMEGRADMTLKEIG